MWGVSSRRHAPTPMEDEKINKRKIGQTNKPGQCVSVDQLQSTLPGFMAQIRGNLPIIDIPTQQYLSIIIQT